MSVTIKKIAEISGVSRSTVDKVLNNRPGVSDKVRQRVKSIAKELGYKPNIIGKALAYQNKPLVLAAVMPDNTFTRQAKVGINKAYKELKDFGVKVEIYTTKDYDIKEQISILSYLIDRKVSGIAIRPVVENGDIKHIVDGAIEKNIPVVTFNSDIMQSRRLCFVGQDLIRAGKTAGSLMAKLLGGHGKVAIITGSLSLLALSQRIKGFREIIETEHPGIEIIDIIETKEQKTLTFEKTIHLLETVKDLNGIYVTSEPINEVGKAVKLLKKSGEIKIICFDFYPEVVKLVKEGIIDFTIGQDPVAQGYKPIKILFDYLFNGKQPQADHIKTTVDIREKENIDYIVE